MSTMIMLRTWLMRRRAEAELARLADRTLHDAGIPRWRIREIARGGAIEPRLVL